MKFSLLTVAFGLGLLSLSACGGAQTRSTEGPDMPEWAETVRSGCQVGSGKFRGDFNFSRDMAATNARAEIAKSIKTKLEGLYKQYRAEGEASEKDFTEEQSTKALRELLDIELTGTVLTRSTTKGGNVWAEVCIDPKTVEKYIQGMKTLSQAQRAALAARAKAEFNELDEALAKKRAAEDR